MRTDLKNLKGRIGCSTILFGQLPLFEALEKIAKNGFQIIDIGVNPEYFPHIDPLQWTDKEINSLIEKLQSLKLRVSTLNVEPAGLAARYPEESLEYIEASFKIAKRIGAYTVTVPPGLPANKDDWEDAAKKAINKFRRLSETARELGLRYSIEAPHTNTLTGNYLQTARLFEMLGDSSIGCTFDTSHGQRNDRRPIAEGIKAVGAEILHVHLRDCFWKNPLLTPGKGRCDFKPFFEALIEKGYRGDFNFELEARPSEAELELHFAKEYIDSLVQGKKLTKSQSVWKNYNRQVVRAIIDMAKNPKAVVVSQPLLKAVLKPIVRYFKETGPRIVLGYEAGWRNRIVWLRIDQVGLKKAALVRKNKNKLIRVAILGCGNVGYNMHAAGFARLPNVEVVGVCDIDPLAAKATARKLGCKFYSDMFDLVEDVKPDLVSNCTKEWTHYRTTMTLLQKGIDVFCEKIMAESIANGQVMVTYALENKRVLGINYNWRYLPGVVKIKQIKESGDLGKLYVLRLFCHPWVWHHCLDLVEYICGSAISVSGLIRQQEPFFRRDPWSRFADEMAYLPDTFAMTMLETEEKIGASVTSSKILGPNSCLFNADALFEKGTISISGIQPHDAIGMVSCSRKGVDIHKNLAPKDGPSTFSITFQRSIEKFVEAYANGSKLPSSGEQGLRIMKIENAIIESAKLGKRIAL